MSRATPRQLQAFSAACYARGLDVEREKAEAAARAGKPFANFTFEDMDKAIRHENNKPPSDFTWRVKDAECRRAEANSDEENANTELLAKWNATFGEDFESTILPIVYTVRNPASPKWILPWNAIFELPTVAERRATLIALLAAWLGMSDLTNLEAARRERVNALAILRTMTEGAS